jgi:BASS family bile acid:Na+ symporter
VVRVAILCLLFNLNFRLVAYWTQLVNTWGTESYLGALAGPFVGLGCGYLLVSSLRVKDVGIRHATETTTAVRNIAPMLLMMIFPFRADPLVTVLITVLNTVGLVIVLLFVLMWRRVAPTSETHAPTSQQARDGGLPVIVASSTHTHMARIEKSPTIQRSQSRL